MCGMMMSAGPSFFSIGGARILRDAARNAANAAESEQASARQKCAESHDLINSGSINVVRKKNAAMLTSAAGNGSMSTLATSSA